MKKLILSLALVVFATAAFAQKKVVRSASSNFKKGNLEVALEEISAALSDPETKDDPANMLLKGQIETKLFSQDDDFAASTVAIGRNAFNSFTKTMEMVDGDKNSKVGKDVWKEEIPGMPDNLRPYSMVSLRLASFDKAIQAYEDEDYTMSYEFFNLVSDIDPADTTANFNAGYLAYTEMGNIEAAKKHFYRLLEVPEYDKLNTYYFLIQIASGEEKDPEAAYKYVTMAKKDFPEDKTLSEFEVQLLLQMNKMDEAFLSVQNALKDDPENAGLLLRYGYLLEQSGDLEGALEQYVKAVKADPDFFEGNYYTGAIYLDRARAILAEVNNLSDAEWEKRADSMTKEAEGLYGDAVPYFTKAAELRPENTEILEILFQIHTRLKNNAEAEKYNQKLISILGEGWMER
ncbi:tetratricopeptide repeat protein [Mongoliitalea daihaiensis]|uniref:tetratricopeptide repeat protein n=1 Tax=Mongoliitalea daihaiensis TaxID=2782006 RepID=UPI001F1C8C90|nr:tetratricopeptide repeat protein [Mongoliitalea daihaiensis]UJP64300.1 tetratricopeptide repeat protein [Mongoliitalea daihaiensis]